LLRADYGTFDRAGPEDPILRCHALSLAGVVFGNQRTYLLFIGLGGLCAS